MTSLRLLAACLAFLLAPAAHAATFRAYLSITGTDNPNCSLGAPCRLIDAALAAANDGGEIWMLDSGNYNLTTVFITKSVTILAVPGAIASILGVGADAINVNSATAKVTLRNLVVQQLPGTTPANGLTVTSAQSVTVERSSFSGFVTAVQVQGGKVLVTDSSLLNSTNGLVVGGAGRAALVRSVIAGNSNYGVNFNATTNTARIDIADSTIVNNAGDAIALQTTGVSVAASVTRSNILGNGGSGVFAAAGTGLLKATITACVMAGNGQGLGAAGAAVSMFALDNTITGSTASGDIAVSGGASFYTSGTNGVGPNGSVSGTITSLPKI